jgi:hypothetical protein
VPPANGDAKVVISYREIDNALTEGVMTEAASTLEEIEGTATQ